MNSKRIHPIFFLLFLCTSILINGCTDDGSLQTDPARRIDLEGQKNFRDLGGYNNIYGELLRWRILFRSGDLHDLTDDDLLMINDLDLQLVIDFRSAEEIEERPDRSPSGSRTLHAPILIEGFNELLVYVLETGDTSPLTVGNIATLYEPVYTDNIDAFKVMLSAVMNVANRPVLIHCRGGENRTGFGAALILASLQVSDAVILEDYLLSNHYLKESTQETLYLFKGAIEQNTGNPPTEDDMLRIRNLIEVRQAYIEAAFQHVVDRYETIDEFIVNGLGITEYEIEVFRRRSLVYLD